jgi:hydrogenase maturation protein HypF
MDKSPLSCSLGRYLDAISSYLGICSKMTYSGEPAMKLEKYLALGKDTYDLDVEIKNNVVQVVDLFNQIDELVKPPFSEIDKANISYSLVKAIVTGLTDIAINFALDKRIKTIGVSGGVSYNTPINEMISKMVNDAGLKLLVHNKIPNGDAGISVGQNVIIGHKLNS